MRRIKKYTPDLNDYMSQCEMNYALMLRVIRFIDGLQASLKNSNYDVEKCWMASASLVPCEISVIDEAKYTTTLLFKLSASEHPLIEPVCMNIRLYHDASVAEVLECNRNHSPAANHKYPEQVKHYPDDKHQRNRLLQQSLVYCLEHPMINEDDSQIRNVSY